MRDPQRIDLILDTLKAIWEKEPDLRLGQLIVNVIRPTEPCPQIFYAEDDLLLQRLHGYLQKQLETNYQASASGLTQQNQMSRFSSADEKIDS